MSMTYANISGQVVLASYQSVLQPGTVTAGQLAETLRAGRLGQDALDWLTASFYKTELELGHCLRLPREGPCECDLYLTCAKFVASPQYAPGLRERLCPDQQLADDARQRGWDREIDRRQRIAGRIRGCSPSSPGLRPAGRHALTRPGKVDARCWRAPLGPRAGQSPPPSSSRVPQ